MQIKRGNIWDTPDRIIFFTANSEVKANGELTMGAGIARHVKQNFPSLPRQFGRIIESEWRSYGVYGIIDPIDTVTCPLKIGAFQTKQDWRVDSDLDLIQFSAQKLEEWIKIHNVPISLNFPGIGCGNLTKQEVLGAISFLSDLVTVYHL